MGVPWEKYQQPATTGSPWEKYAAASAQEPPMVPGGSVRDPNYKEPSFLEKLQDPTTTAGAILKAPDMFLRGQTLGLSDYAQAGMNYAADKAQGLTTGEYGKSFEQDLQAQRAQNKAQRQASPVTSYVAEVLGGLTSPAFQGTGKISVTNPAARGGGMTGVVDAATSKLPRYAQYGAQGAAAGAMSGAGNAQSEQGGVPSVGDLAKSVATNTAIGAATGVIVPAAIEGGAKLVGKTANMLATKAPTMTQDEFKAAAQAGYKAAEDAGVYIKPEDFQKFVAALPDELNGYHPDVTPTAGKIVNVLQKAGEKGPITLDALDNLRSIASGASISRDANEARLAGAITHKIDDFVEGLKPENILLGADDAKGAVDALTNARQLWKTYSKMKTVSDIVDTGDLLNDPNWIKAQFRAIVKNPTKLNRYTEAEKKAIADVARTGTLEKVLKIIPLRGLQMASTYADPIAQAGKINSLQSLIAGGGRSAPPVQISPDIAKLLARSFGSTGGVMTGGSNQ